MVSLHKRPRRLRVTLSILLAATQLTAHIVSAKDQLIGPNASYFFEDEQTGRNPLFQHKPLLPINRWDIAGFVAAALGLVIAAGGGIGGGGILVPIYGILLKFSTKFAIPLSNITIFGGSLSNMGLNLSKRHPLADRPLVDWDLVLLMEPLTMAGAILGSFLNKVMPSALLVTLLVLQLLYIAYRTSKVGVCLHEKECAREKGLPLAQAVVSTVTERAKLHSVTDVTYADPDTAASLPALLSAGLIDHRTLSSKSFHQRYGGLQQEDFECLKLRNQILEEERHVPFKKIGLLTGVFALVLATNLLKGGGAFSPLGIRCGGYAYWSCTLWILVMLISLSLYVRHDLLRRGNLKAQCGYEYVEGDIRWTAKTTIQYPCACFFGGVFAGLFGVGGGIVKGPLMLVMGVHPMVASACSACMIFFTSLTAATSFIVFGLVQLDYALVLFLLGIVATAVGQLVVSYLVEKYNRSSPIVISIGAVLLLSALLLWGQSIYYEFNPSQDVNHSSGGFCGVGE